MSAEHNRRLALRWMDEIWNQRNDAIIDELVTPQSVGHSEGMPDIEGVAGVRSFCNGLLDAFPDVRVAVEDCVAQDDSVVLRWRARATHQGHGLGFPASGQAVDFWGITWFRFAHGRMVEGWDAWNQGGVFQRLQAKVPGAAA